MQYNINTIYSLHMLRMEGTALFNRYISKRALALLLAALFAFALAPGALAITGDVPYIDADGILQTVTNTIDIVTSANAETWPDGWYSVSGTVTIDQRVTVSGDVHLILIDGATLTVNGGIQRWRWQQPHHLRAINRNKHDGQADGKRHR